MKEKCLEEHLMILEWIAMRKQTIKMMRDTADEIDKHYKDINISRIVGASTAVAGGLMAVGGAIVTLETAAPITAPVIAAGVGISIAGGGISAGASFADVIISKLKLSDVQKQIDADNEMLQQMVQHSSEIKKIEEAIQRHSSPSHESKVVEATISSIAQAGSGVPDISYAEGKGANKLGEIALKTGKHAALVGKMGDGGAAGSVALQGDAMAASVIPLNIAEIVMNGISLFKGSETKASHKLREKANKYEEQMNVIMTLITPDSQ